RLHPYGDHRQSDDDGRTAPLAVAFDGDGALMRFDQLTRNRKTEANAAMNPRGRAVRLAETIEHVRQKLRLDADAAVGDANPDRTVLATDRHIDAAAFVGELHGVADQVEEHLFEPADVAKDDGVWRGGKLQLDSLRRRRRH